MSKMGIQDLRKYETHFTLFSTDLINKQPHRLQSRLINLFLESDDSMAIHFADETFFYLGGMHADTNLTNAILSR